MIARLRSAHSRIRSAIKALTADRLFLPAARRLTARSAPGLIVYRGPSMLTGRPIVAIVTFKSRNPKTGPMAQLWILSDEGQTPGAAIRSGADASICGACPLRAWTADGRKQVRRCYVNPMGPASVYRAFLAGRYPVATPYLLWLYLTGRSLRLGAYGDPGALPIDVVRTLTAFVRRWTGYTHAWRTIDAAWAGYVMASADAAADRDAARQAGYRVFRVRTAAEPVAPNEVTCPASDEAGKRTTCERCALCAGNAGRHANLKDVVILAHGVGKRFFNLAPVAA